ncbi:hypothetical protein [Pollutimonas bauzanensis]
MDELTLLAALTEGIELADSCSTDALLALLVRIGHEPGEAAI